MDANLLRILGEIAGIGGVALGTLILIFRDVIRKNIFPRLDKKQAYALLRLIIILTWAIALVGLGAWVYVRQASPSGRSDQRGDVPKASAMLDRESTAPRYRIVFYSIGGHALDFVVRGKLDPKWETVLGGQPYIVPNATFDHLRSIIDHYSESLQESYFTQEGTGVYDEELATRYRGQAFFVGSWPPRYFQYSVNEIDLSDFLNPASRWQVELTDRPLVPPKAFTTRLGQLTSDPAAYFFWRFVDGIDLNRFASEVGGNATLMRFYRDITREYLPPDFAILSLYYEGCGDTATFLVTPRYVRLRVAVVENVSNKPIRISNARLREVSLKRLRSGSEDEELLSAAEEKSRSLFPPGVLAANEKLLIPLETYLSYEDADKRVLKFLEGGGATEASAVPEVLQMPVLMDTQSERLLNINRDTFERFLKKSRPAIAGDREYILGPSMSVTSLNIDGVETPLRRADSKNFVLKSGSPVGSCPYVFTYAPPGYWVPEGHMIYGYRGKRKENTERKTLTHFDGRILIRENDPETSYIDMVRVEAKCPDRSVTGLLPDEEVLREVDGRYLVLAQGKELLLNFHPSMSMVTNCIFTLVSTGYYVTHPLGSPSSLTR